MSVKMKMDRVLYTWALVCAFAFLLAPLTACYTPQELRAKADAMPDPRQVEADRVWRAIKTVVDEEGWPIELESREDLLVSTTWLGQEGATARHRVRFLVLIAPVGMGINVTIKNQRRDTTDDAEGWTEDKDEAVAAKAKKEEERLVQRVYTLWQQYREE